MALNDATLKAALRQVFAANIPNPTDQQNAELDAIAGGIATAVSAYVRSIGITYSTGLVAPNGPVTGTLGYTIN